MSDLKHRVKRIDSNYYKVRDPITRWKLWLAVGAAAVFGGWLVAEAVSEFFPGGRLRITNPELYSRGAVSQVHAAWNDQCDKCHENFSPISEQADWARNVFGGMTTPNAKCEACHAGAIHSPSMKDADVSCASCHREHQGPHSSLLANMEQTCIRCHKDLGPHIASHADAHRHAVDPHIDSFASVSEPGSHPPFLSLESDPGTIEFNHFVHLNPKAGGTKKWQLENVIQLPEGKDRAEALARYKPFERPDGVVQLECRACHVVDAEDFGIPNQGFSKYGITSSREHRRYMMPIRYQNQCRACHPNLVDRDLGAEPPPDNFGKKKDTEIPHGITPAEVEKFLLAYRGGDGNKVESDLRKIFPRQARGEFACGKCHHYQFSDGKSLPDTIDPAGIPEVWLRHGLFDHSAHRKESCERCHPKVAQSKQTKDVLILGIDNCRECHSPKGSQSTDFTNGARSDCMTCHTYHNGAHPLAGPGALARGRKSEVSSAKP